MKAAERITSRGIVEAELAGGGSWLDVGAWVLDRALEGPPGIVLDDWVDGMFLTDTRKAGGLKEHLQIHLDFLILRGPWTSRRRCSANS
jgi:hypothetical protein